MPTYEYECAACGHRFEVFQRMSDDPVETCPECGEDEAERKISAGGGLVFKGSGFYATDYRDPPPDRSQGAEERGDGDETGDGGEAGDGGDGGGDDDG